MLRPASSNAPSWLRQRSLVAWAHGNNGLRGAAFSFLGNVLSSSVLGLPSCFRRCGWLLATLLLVGVAATQMFTLKALVFVSALRQRGSYEGLTEASLGRAARVACTLCVLLLQAGSLVALLELLADLLVASVSPLMPPGADVGRVHVMSALCFGVLLPLCALVRGEEAMSQASVVSVVFLCGFTAATMGIAFFPSATNVKEGAPPGPLALWRPQGVALSLPVIIFALTGHSALFPCLAAMKSPTVTRADALLLGSTRAATLIYAAVGVAGYFTFREATAGTLLRNLSEVERLGAPERAAVLALKLGFALSTAGAVPITLLPVRDAALAALRGSSGAEEEGAVLLPQGFLAHSALCGALLGCCLLAAVAMPNVEVVFALTGATASVALAYVLPCACFLATSGRAEPPPRPAPAAAQLRGLPPAAAPEAEAEDVLWASQAAADAEAEVEQWAEHGARTDAEVCTRGGAS